MPGFLMKVLFLSVYLCLCWRGEMDFSKCCNKAFCSNLKLSFEAFSSNLKLTSILGAKYHFYSHCTDKENEAQRG